jgi:hypothetical protein
VRFSYRLLYGAALLVLLVECCAFAQPQGASQLYLLTGLATRDDAFRTESMIIGVDVSAPALVSAATFVDATEGSAFIIADHERRFVVAIGPNDNPNKLTALNMDAPTAARTIPPCQCE